MEPMAEQRARLAAVDDELAKLQARYELAMSAFKFDEASALQQQIAALEAERRLLAQALPPPGAPEPPDRHRADARQTTAPRAGAAHALELPRLDPRMRCRGEPSEAMGG